MLQERFIQYWKALYENPSHNMCNMKLLNIDDSQSHYKINFLD